MLVVEVLVVEVLVVEVGLEVQSVPFLTMLTSGPGLVRETHLHDQEFGSAIATKKSRSHPVS